MVRQARLPAAIDDVLEQIERHQLPLLCTDVMPMPQAANQATDEYAARRLDSHTLEVPIKPPDLHLRVK